MPCVDTCRFQLDRTQAQTTWQLLIEWISSILYHVHDKYQIVPCLKAFFNQMTGDQVTGHAHCMLSYRLQLKTGDLVTGHAYCVLPGRL
jgi:hypothetical protein